MEDYRIRVRLKSPLGTPWQSDTIFGHLCWQVAYGAINIGIGEFLKPFKEGRPPFVLSDGFPSGLMPRPQLAMITAEAESLEQYVRQKRWKKAVYLTLEDFLRVCRSEQPKQEPQDDPWRTIMIPHASLDRNTSTTSERDRGGFFETESLYLEGHDSLDVYLRCEVGWAEKVFDLLQAVSVSGYGRDKSTGMGTFEAAGMERFDRFENLSGANGFISISSMVPAESDPVEARYRLRTKYGKLGEGSSPTPFKRPLLQMEPGAVFRTDQMLKPFYGRVVEGIAPDRAEVVQNCYALAVPCLINTSERKP